MAEKFISLEKRSKREQRAYHNARRNTWGPINPVTRAVPNKKAFSKAARSRAKAEMAAFVD